MYIDTKDNDEEGRIVLNAAKADFATIAGNLNNISTAVNVPVYFSNGTPLPVASIPGSLVTDLSDKYLSVTKGGTVNGDVAANKFVGYLEGHADSADFASNANYAENADYAYHILSETIDFTDYTPQNCLDRVNLNNAILYGQILFQSPVSTFATDGPVDPSEVNYYCPCETRISINSRACVYQIVTDLNLNNQPSGVLDSFDYSNAVQYYRSNRTLNEWTEWQEVEYGSTFEPTGDFETPVFINSEGVAEACTGVLPLSAGDNHKLTGALGLMEGVMYGTSLPEDGFDGQLFFLAEDAEDPPLYVPDGGVAGDVLIKKSSADGDYQWNELVALPKGGDAGNILIKNGPTDGDATWKELDYASASVPGLVSTGTQTFAGSKTFSGGVTCASSLVGKGNVILQNTSLTKGTAPASDDAQFISFVDSQGINAVNRIGLINSYVTSGNVSTLRLNVYKPESGVNTNAYLYIQYGADGTTKAGSSAPFYGAVWNDYAEFRAQKEIIEPGYCVASTNNGQVYKTTEKFQACDGIVSDTFGFSIGETDECKTPLAVAGRVLAYCEGNRYDYHSGDTVCAGPDGKVCKMTRKEIREWPDRIVGIVSEIPEYEIWGDGNVPVNGRIWIKVR